MEIVGNKPLSFFAFVLLIILYAFFGSPTPDTITPIYFILGGLLIIACFPGFLGLIQNRSRSLAVLIFASLVPLLLGVLNAHDTVSIIRDLIALLFFALPLFVSSQVKTPSQKNWFLVTFIVLGLVFSVRGILASLALTGGNLSYFSNSPAVLFSCAYLLGMALQGKKHNSLSSRCRPGSFILSIFTDSGLRRNDKRSNLLQTFITNIIFIALALIPLLAMQLTLQRASLAFVGGAIILFTLHLFYKKPLHAMVICAGFIGIMILMLPVFSLAFDALVYKTQLYGGNMRLAELSAVWNAIAVHPVSALFGLGWGASFNSPAVADIQVTYTHSFFTFILLKTGLVGLCVAGAYMWHLFKHVIAYYRQSHDMVFTLALIGAFIIPLFLYASYKSFDFGLVLLLMRVGIDRRIIDPPPPSD